MQDRPVCFRCRERVEYDPIFEAPCGHDDHPSLVFHGICLMEWREHRDAMLRELRRLTDEMTPLDDD